MPNLRNGSKGGDLNPGSLDCESGILPLKAGADQRQCPSQWPHNAAGEACSSGVLVNIPQRLTSLAVGKIIQRVWYLWPHNAQVTASANLIAFGRSRDAATEIEWPMKNVAGDFWEHDVQNYEWNVDWGSISPNVAWLPVSLWRTVTGI